MKTNTFRYFAFAIIILLSACNSKTTSSTADGTTRAKHDEQKESKAEQVDQTTDSPTTQLVDLIRRLPGVNVRGSHPNVIVTVRGRTSVTTERTVLYVVDNVPMGNDYGRIVEVVDMTRVKSVNVLKGGETAIYGRQGDNGVIIIKMKKIRED